MGINLPAPRWTNWQEGTPDWWARCNKCGFEGCAGSAPLTEADPCPECNPEAFPKREAVGYQAP